VDLLENEFAPDLIAMIWNEKPASGASIFVSA
jgi:hypothetical protein